MRMKGFRPQCKAISSEITVYWGDEVIRHPDRESALNYWSDLEGNYIFDNQFQSAELANRVYGEIQKGSTSVKITDTELDTAVELDEEGLIPEGYL